MYSTFIKNSFIVNTLDKYFRLVTMLIGMAILFCGCANLSGQNQPDSGAADMGSTSSEQSETDSATGKDQSAKASYRFTDVPVPSKFKLDRDKSFIYEAGSFKAGTITYNGWSKLDALVDFYKKEMPNFEWEMISIFEYDAVTLVYSKEGWNCTVHLSSGNLGGSKIRIQIGPINTP